MRQKRGHSFGAEDFDSTIMALTLILILTRGLLLLRHPIPLSKRLLSTLSITQPPPLPSVFFSCRSLPSVFPSTPTRFTSIRCRIHRVGTPYRIPSSVSDYSGFPPIERPPYCPDYDHWFISIDRSFVQGFTEQQMIDFYIQTLAKVLESKEEAKNNIYYVSCQSLFGFCCEIDKETSNKLKGLPCVINVYPNFDLDAKDKQYWGHLHHREIHHLFKVTV